MKPMSSAAAETCEHVSLRRRVLVVDDEPTIREVVGQYLELEGFSVIKAADGLEALHLAETCPADLIILDLTLPGVDGLEVCRRLRATSAVPILMLTARAEEVDQLAGFEIGTDDYVTKPLLPRVLIMRVRALMRRVELSTAPAIALQDTLRVDDLVIRPKLREVERGGIKLDLTAKEFDLLEFLATHPRQVFTRRQVLDHVWDYEYISGGDTVTVHMRRLREKVERDPAHPRHLRTVRGVGYKFVA